TVRVICNDGRPVPWERSEGPGRKWFDLFLKRHPRLSERSSRIYEANRVTAHDEPRLQQFFTNWQGYLDKEKSEPGHVWNTDETGVMPQGTKSNMVIAKRGKTVVGTKRSNSRENVIVVATINAAGAVIPPLILFKGRRVQAAWLGAPSPNDARYSATGSSFMQGQVFVNYLQDFHQQMASHGLNDGKSHVLALDGHASHVHVKVISLAKSLNIDLVQLSSHTSRITQPLDLAIVWNFQ
ncbi:unnamed protein product, partial [Laminaria digitata]